jgi:hypothetical protein
MRQGGGGVRQTHLCTTRDVFLQPSIIMLLTLVFTCAGMCERGQYFFFGGNAAGCLS